MLDGVNGIAHYQCSQLLGDRYERVAPTLPPDRQIGMDDVGEIPFLVKFASELELTTTADWLRTHW